MRKIQLLLVAALLVLASAAPAQAQADPQGPTIIYKGHDGDLIYLFGGSMDQVAVFSSDPQFYKSGWCDGQWPTPDDTWIGVRYTNVAIADFMKFNSTATTAMFTRVYQLSGSGGGPFDTFDAWACSLVSGQEGPVLAEGITQWLSTDRNKCGLGPGRTSWSWSAHGLLSAPTYCAKGIASLEMRVRGMLAIGADVTEDCAFDPSDIRDIQIDWPCLTCIGPPAQ